MGSHSYIEDARNSKIYININGDLFKRSDAKISVFDSGFLLGDGVWEGIRLHKSQLIFIDDHIKRLFSSAQGISMNIGYSKNEIIDEIKKVLLKNKMIDDVHIRLIITRGDKITPYQSPEANVGPTNLIIIPEYKKTDSKTYTEGITIGRVDNIRPNKNILSPHLNTLSKLNCILASIEAKRKGFHEGIMNDLNGFISTCNSTNLFFIINNSVITSKGNYCLNGITRGKIIRLCKDNGINCFEKDFKFKDINRCQEAFVTGTFAGVIPVSKIEKRTLNSTSSDSLVNKIRKLYNEHIESFISI